MSKLAVACLLALLHGCGTQHVDTEETMPSDEIEVKVSEKNRILAKMLSGRWIENPYFSFKDFHYLKLTTFYSNRIITDAAFAETIQDSTHFEVRRTHYNFSGDPQFTEKVALPKGEFWFRVKYLQRQLEESEGQPILSIELPLANSLRALKRHGAR